MSLFTEARNWKEGIVTDHTPTSALSAGQMIQVNGLAAFACEAIAANAKGAIQIKEHAKIQAAAVVGNVGDPVGWDEDANPVNGTAGSGAIVTNLAVADFICGSLAYPLAAADGEAIVDLNVFLPQKPAWPNRVHELKTDNYTVDAEDVGKVLHIATDAKTFTLPAMAAGFAGCEVTFVNDGADGAVLLKIAPNASDKIMGPDIAGTDNKYYANTKATAKRYDYITLRGDGTNGWWIIDRRGTWAAEA